jgi:formiminoglutamase
MDVLDQTFVPGVPAPSPGGMTVWDAIEALEWLGTQKNVQVLDIVCADPTQDFRDLTTRVASNLVLSFLTGLALRKRCE